MENFLEETIKEIKDSGHKTKDIMFIGSSNGEYRMSWDKFKEKANFWYDEGYGASKIATDLIIYFNDNTYMIRGEYDGSEWWEYPVKKIFKKDDNYKEFEILGGDKYLWNTVFEMNFEMNNEDNEED